MRTWETILCDMLYPKQLEKIMHSYARGLNSVHRETVLKFNAGHTAFYKEVSSVIQITHTSRNTWHF
jgi:hypothetical protein